MIGQHTSRPVTVWMTDPWDGTAQTATDIIDWALSHNGTARFVGVGEEHHLRSGERDFEFIPAAKRIGGSVTQLRRDAPAFLAVDTPEGTMRMDAGDRLVHGTMGELYPIKPEAYAAKYDHHDPKLPTTPGSVVEAIMQHADFDIRTVVVRVATDFHGQLRGLPWINTSAPGERFTDDEVRASKWRTLYRHPDVDPSAAAALAKGLVE